VKTDFAVGPCGAFFLFLFLGTQKKKVRGSWHTNRFIPFKQYLVYYQNISKSNNTELFTLNNPVNLGQSKNI
jgi:hypothetical protein